MGAANIIEDSLRDTTTSVWSRVDKYIPQVNVDTSKHRQGFVEFCVLVGLVASVKLTLAGARSLHKLLVPNKALSAQAFTARYGEAVWAVIADVRGNQEYCDYLAERGVSLVLLGKEAEVRVSGQTLRNRYPNVRVVEHPVDWTQPSFNYEDFIKVYKQYDIAFLVLPRLEQVPLEASFGTHVEQIPAYERYFLLVRYLGPQMQWRANQSAIILPSLASVDQIKPGHGVKQGFNSAVDAFIRIINFELRNNFDVIAARGSVQQCFRDLGKQPVSY